MRYTRKGTRELHLKPFRISYTLEEDYILLMTIYHKDEQTP